MKSTQNKIQIIPAIDIIGGKCVRLMQGDYSRLTSYDEYSPVEMAKRMAAAGVKRIHLVDLEGAKCGEPRNLDTLRQISTLGLLEVEWGGGIKTSDHLVKAMEDGADHVIVGSVAAKNPLLMEQWLNQFGGSKIILGADVRDGKVAVSGWLESTGLTIDDLIGRFLPLGLKECIVTDISCDGMLKGPATRMYTALSERYPQVVFTVSGGISGMNDIRELAACGLKRVIVGKAIYEGKITFEEISEYAG